MVRQTKSWPGDWAKAAAKVARPSVIRMAIIMGLGPYWWALRDQKGADRATIRGVTPATRPAHVAAAPWSATPKS